MFSWIDHELPARRVNKVWSEGRYFRYQTDGCSPQAFYEIGIELNLKIEPKLPPEPSSYSNHDCFLILISDRAQIGDCSFIPDVASVQC